MSNEILNLVQLVVIPMFVVFYKLMNDQLKELKAWNVEQEKKIHNRQTKDECKQKHGAIEKVLGNGLVEAFHALSERVRAIEVRHERKDGDT